MLSRSLSTSTLSCTLEDHIGHTAQSGQRASVPIGRRRHSGRRQSDRQKRQQKSHVYVRMTKCHVGRDFSSFSGPPWLWASLCSPFFFLEGKGARCGGREGHNCVPFPVIACFCCAFARSSFELFFRHRGSSRLLTGVFSQATLRLSVFASRKSRSSSYLLPGRLAPVVVAATTLQLLLLLVCLLALFVAVSLSFPVLPLTCCRATFP